MPLTARERGLLRNKIARTAVQRRVPNPLVTKHEREDEALDLIPNIVEKFHEDPDNWGHMAQRFTRRVMPVDDPDDEPLSRILDSLKKKTGGKK